MITMTLREPELKISLNEDKLSSLVKSNISCHFNKPLSSDLIEVLTKQIIESIEFFLSKND